MSKSIKTEYVNPFKQSQHFSQQDFGYHERFGQRELNSNLKCVSQGIYTIKILSEQQRCQLQIRNSLAMEYLPKFQIIQERNDLVKVRLKQYSLQLLPWLQKQDSLFKINVTLGLFLAFEELFQIYGYFQINSNLMKLSQDQQIAIWINKNYMLNQPQNRIINNQQKAGNKFIYKFCTIFNSFILSKKLACEYESSQQYIAHLLSIKKRQEMHKNCHQFLKSNYKMSSSRKSINTMKPLCGNMDQRFSLYPNNNILDGQATIELQKRFSQSPIKIQKQNSCNYLFNSQRVIQQTPFSKKNNQTYQSQGNFSKTAPSFKYCKKTSIEKCLSGNKEQLYSKGELFKKYLLYNSSKFQKMNKMNSQKEAINNETIIKQDKSKMLIFRSEVIDSNFNFKSSQGSHGPFNFQKVYNSKQKVNFYTPVRVRKFSGNNQQTAKGSQKANIKQLQKKLQCSSSEGHFFTISQNRNTQSRQRLKHSFPYKTSSTFNTIRNSNNHLYHGVNQIQDKNLLLSDKNNKVQGLQILQQNQIQNDLNNIFSAEASNITHQSQDQRKMDEILTQFESVIF